MSETDPDRIVAAHSLRMMKLSDALTTRAACQAMMNAPKTYALLRALAAAHVDVSPGSGIHAALMDFARVEATKAADVAAEFQRANPITIRVETSEKAQRLIDTVRSEQREEIARLRRGLEGAKDWAARSRASGLEQWCSEALSPTGALAVFPHSDTTALAEKTAQLKQVSDDLKREAELVTELADALENTAPVVGPDGPCWCDPMMEKKNGHQWDTGCIKRRNAIQRAGRLPL